MTKGVGLFLFVFCLTFSQVAAASELRTLYRTPRSLGMGGVAVGIADDDSALWRNPAGLADGTQKPHVSLMGITVESNADTVLNYSDFMDTFDNFGISSLNGIMGSNLYAHYQAGSAIFYRGMGFGLISDGQAAIYAKNQAYPDITFGWQTTNGFQFGYGVSLMSPGRRSKGPSTQPDLKVGLASKLLWRRGGYRELSTLDLLETANEVSGRGILSRLAGSWGFGVGFDTGVQFTLPVSKQWMFNFGSSITDIGDTTFDSEADPIEQNWTAGMGVKFMPSSLIGILVAFDHSHILQSTDIRQKNHIGFELDFPGIDIQLGLNQTFVTYGLSVDLWLLKLSAASYAQELATSVGQDSDRRYVLKLDFQFAL